jgi:hypothetical protein
MNAETLNAMPEGAKLMMRVGLMSELEKMRTLRMGASYSDARHHYTAANLMGLMPAHATWQLYSRCSHTTF